LVENHNLEVTQWKPTDCLGLFQYYNYVIYLLQVHIFISRLFLITWKCGASHMEQLGSGSVSVK